MWPFKGQIKRLHLRHRWIAPPFAVPKMRITWYVRTSSLTKHWHPRLDLIRGMQWPPRPPRKTIGISMEHSLQNSLECWWAQMAPNEKYVHFVLLSDFQSSNPFVFYSSNSKCWKPDSEGFWTVTFITTHLHLISRNFYQKIIAMIMCEERS